MRPYKGRRNEIRERWRNAQGEIMSHYNYLIIGGGMTADAPCRDSRTGLDRHDRIDQRRARSAV